MSIATSVVELDPKEASKSRSGSHQKSGLIEDCSASSEARETVHIPFFASRNTLTGARNPMSIATSVVELDSKEASKSRPGNHQKSGLTEDCSARSEARETFHIPFFASQHTLAVAKNTMSIATSIVVLDPKEASKSRSGSHQKIQFNRG